MQPLEGAARRRKEKSERDESRGSMNEGEGFMGWLAEASDAANFCPETAQKAIKASAALYGTTVAHMPAPFPLLLASQQAHRLPDLGPGGRLHTQTGWFQ